MKKESEFHVVPASDVAVKPIALARNEEVSPILGCGAQGSLDHSGRCFLGISEPISNLLSDPMRP